jgi:hypothetical protein
MSRQELHFDAVVAKNDIAREVRDRIHRKEEMNAQFILSCLEEIEKYIGTLNQPSVKDIVDTTKYDL